MPLCPLPVFTVRRKCVIPSCAVTGEAAGLAAAMGGDVTALHIAELQDALARRGVLLHEQQLPPR